MCVCVCVDVEIAVGGLVYIHHSHFCNVITNEAAKSAKCSWNADMRTDLNQNILGGMNINLQVAGLVQGAIKKCHQCLVHNIWANVLWIPLHLS